ncbi:Malonyl-[acyl-carrier protein] O-methyltransferase [Buchnera aphidicola (Eriosoma lanigerum)]|uniref:malonyl-ACP O-methyltransferase BioC n=1 Tax=Buchnera aphidicola TaxID=9 RepID=UPI003464CD8C
MNIIINKKKISNSFNRAVQYYDKYAKLQKIVGNILMSKIDFQKNMFILDAGSGTGWFSKKLKQKSNKVIALDLSQQMLMYARSKNTANYYLEGDIENLPFKNNIFDLTWSNLSLQWCENFSRSVQELCRVTQPGGTVIFSTLIKGSLSELSKAWKKIDNYIHVNQFITVQKILHSCCNKILVLEIKTIKFSFTTILEALLSVKRIGATYVNIKKNKSVLNKSIMKQLQYSWPSKKNKFLLSYKLAIGIIYI